MQWSITSAIHAEASAVAYAELLHSLLYRLTHFGQKSRHVSKQVRLLTSREESLPGIGVTILPCSLPPHRRTAKASRKLTKSVIKRGIMGWFSGASQALRGPHYVPFAALVLIGHRSEVKLRSERAAK
jgi:hypothetical protein